MSLDDQKVDTIPPPQLELRFLKLVSLADRKVETTAKAAEVFSAKAETSPSKFELGF